MKKALLLLVAIVGLHNASMAKGSKAKTLTIEISFKGVEEGYDHLTKSEIFINGDFVGSTVEHKETRKISKTIEVPSNSFDFKLVNFAYYEGKWEEHTIENNYSIDCVVDERLSLGKKKKIVIVFDLDSETSFKVQ